MTARARLLNKNLVLLWQGQFVSRLGSQAFMIAMMFWLKHATGSATLMGTLMMLSMLPLVVLSPFGGTFADRHSRRAIIVASDLIHGIFVVSLAGLMFAAPQATGAIVVWLVVVAVVSGVVSAFFQPAIRASIPSIVPEDRVAAANSLNEGSYHVATLAGQAIGGVLFRVLGAPFMFLIDGITFLYSALSEAFISIPQSVPARTSIWREELRRFNADTREGMRYIWARAGMRNLLVASALLNFFAMPYLVLFPFYVEDVLGTTPDWYGYILAGYSAGSLAGYAFYGALNIRGRARSRLLIVFLIALSVGLAAMGLVRRPILSLGLITLVGFFGGSFNVATITLIQVGTPSGMRGRVFGLQQTLVAGLTPLSMVIAGVVADLIGRNIPAVYVVCGVVLVIISVVIAANRDYREFLALEPAAGAAREHTVPVEEGTHPTEDDK
jgi:MFS family permease